jgi:recombination protein RecT
MCTVAKEMIKTDRAVDRIRTAIARSSETDRFVLLASIEISKNPKLAQCDGDSVLACLVRAAQAGLYVGSGDVFLVPYKNTCTLQLGYQGILKLLYRGGMKSIKANVVYSNDKFEYEDGTQTRVSHRRSLGDRGNFVCAYAIAEFHDTSVIEIMDKNEIDVSRTCSMAADSLPWKNFYDEMAKKTVIKRMFKRLPQENYNSNTLDVIRDDDKIVEINDNPVNFLGTESDNGVKSDAVADIL